MTVRYLVDTGPLVALLNGRDAHHDWARTTLDTIAPPLWTCEAVLSEACFLLRKHRDGVDAVMGLVSDGIVRVDLQLTAEITAVRSLMLRYASVPMSLADACLVRMTEITPRSSVITLDRDFAHYRRNRRQAIPHLSPGR